MSLSLHLEALLPSINYQRREYKPTANDIISLMDLTLLDKNATLTELDKVTALAIKHRVAALCVFTEHLPKISERLPFQKATVVNFPKGLISTKKTIEEIIFAKSCGAEEIDYVFPYNNYLEGEKTKALEDCHQIIATCKEKNLVSKVILETGAFPGADAIYEVSSDVIPLGCDFLKTSTGKISSGASFFSVFSMLAAITDSGLDCGIKISGGIKTFIQAVGYLNLAYQFTGKIPNSSWFRLGASSLIDELIKIQASSRTLNTL